jgi:ribosomal-protein-alanine N-acetyltransferase
MHEVSIKTDRLVVRNLVMNDLDNFHQYRSNPEVTKYQGFDVMTKDACASFIQSQQDKVFGKAGQWIQYAVELKETKQLIGDCAVKLDPSDIRLAEIGITISDLHQRNGYAKEVMNALLSWLFETQHICRVTEIVDADNIASINLLKSLNFRQEGHFIENIFFKGKWGSEFQFALLKREWNI